MSNFSRAADLAPENARYAYVYGVALHSTGQPELALDVLNAVHQRRPGDRDILIALTTFSRDAGDVAAATNFAAKLVALAPEDMAARRLLQELQSGDR